MIDFGHYTVVWAHKKSLIPLSAKVEWRGTSRILVDASFSVNSSNISKCFSARLSHDEQWQSNISVTRQTVSGRRAASVIAAILDEEIQAPWLRSTRVDRE